MKLGRECPKKFAGYSLVEMMMTLAVGLILVSVALPTMVGAVQSYRLNSVSQQLQGLVDLTRYTAIRRNAVVSLRSFVQGGNTVFYVDLNGNTQLDVNEPLVMLPSDMQLANGQSLTPNPASLGIGATQDFTTQITFDYRGTLSLPPGAPLIPYFMALGYVTQTQFGCRAVTVTPMGQSKIWKAPSGGAWSGM